MTDAREIVTQDLFYGYTSPTVFKYVGFAATTAGSPNTIVAAVTDKKIRVISICYAAQTAATLHSWIDNTPTALSGASMSVTTTPFSGTFLGGLMETGVGKALQLTVVTAASTINGFITYVEI